MVEGAQAGDRHVQSGLRIKIHEGGGEGEGGTGRGGGRGAVQDRCHQGNELRENVGLDLRRPVTYQRKARKQRRLGICGTAVQAAWKEVPKPKVGDESRRGG